MVRGFHRVNYNLALPSRVEPFDFTSSSQNLKTNKDLKLSGFEE